MVGDFLREAAVLVIVFYPLDRYFNIQSPEHINNSIPVSKIVGLSVLLLISGIALERLDFGVLAITCVDRAVVGLTWVRSKLERGPK